jgi:hypothetical protein
MKIAQPTAQAAARVTTQAIYACTTVNLLPFALAAEDNYPREDGSGANSMRDIVEQTTFRVHECAGTASTCMPVGQGHRRDHPGSPQRGKARIVGVTSTCAAF